MHVDYFGSLHPLLQARLSPGRHWIIIITASRVEMLIGCGCDGINVQINNCWEILDMSTCILIIMIINLSVLILRSSLYENLVLGACTAYTAAVVP